MVVLLAVWPKAIEGKEEALLIFRHLDLEEESSWLPNGEGT
jgi:hypothetical protein